MSSMFSKINSFSQTSRNVIQINPSCLHSVLPIQDKVTMSLFLTKLTRLIEYYLLNKMIFFGFSINDNIESSVLPYSITLKSMK